MNKTTDNLFDLSDKRADAILKKCNEFAFESNMQKVVDTLIKKYQGNELYFALFTAGRMIGKVQGICQIAWTKQLEEK